MTARPEAGLIVGWLSHPIGRLPRQSSEPGAALTAPALAHTYGRGASVSDRTCAVETCAKPVRHIDWCDAHYQRWHKHGHPTAGGPGKAPAGAPSAFIRQAAASSTDACIEWPYSRTGNGYGKLYVGSKLRQAHRVVLEIAAGPPPPGRIEAAHAPGICHNRLCVNPRHLRWATVAENHADKVVDGTHRRGERTPTSKLAPADVLAIFASPRPGRELAAELAVSATTISDIRVGRTWAWLTGAQQ